MADLTVVLAEPSRVQAGIMKKYLADMGIGRVHAAATGREALALPRAFEADVLLGAMNLPDVSGPELAADLLADPERARVGFVLATSESDLVESARRLPESPRVVLLP